MEGILSGLIFPHFPIFLEWPHNAFITRKGQVMMNLKNNTSLWAFCNPSLIITESQESRGSSGGSSGVKCLSISILELYCQVHPTPSWHCHNSPGSISHFISLAILETPTCDHPSLEFFKASFHCLFLLLFYYFHLSSEWACIFKRCTRCLVSLMAKKCHAGWGALSSGQTPPAKTQAHWGPEPQMEEWSVQWMLGLCIKWITNENRLYSTGNSKCFVVTWMEMKSQKGEIYVYV